MIGTPWSAPAWMKTNGSLIGGRLIDDPRIYEAYARYFVRFVREYRRSGVPVYAVTVQNEPQNRRPSGYPGMDLPVAQEAKLIVAIGRAFRRAGIDTKILGYDHNWSTHPDDIASTPPGEDPEPEYPSDLLWTEAGRWLAGTAFHCYSGDPSRQTDLHRAFPDKGIWFTECSGSHGPTDPPAQVFADTLKWHARNLVIGVTRNWGKTVVNWNLALDPAGGTRRIGSGLSPARRGSAALCSSPTPASSRPATRPRYSGRSKRRRSTSSPSRTSRKTPTAPWSRAVRPSPASTTRSIRSSPSAAAVRHGLRQGDQLPAHQRRPDGDYRGYGKATPPMLPSIGVPTTAGTGSEAQIYALIADRNAHEDGVRRSARPRSASRSSIRSSPPSQPRPVTATAGIDAIAHAVEIVRHHARRPRCRDMFSREAWRLLDANFERVLQHPADLEARGAMQLGAHLAGVAIEQSMLGAAHACANPLTARFGITHGVAAAGCCCRTSSAGTGWWRSRATPPCSAHRAAVHATRRLRTRSPGASRTSPSPAACRPGCSDVGVEEEALPEARRSRGGAMDRDLQPAAVRRGGGRSKIYRAAF